jgi:lycopene beta-cyclase
MADVVVAGAGPAGWALASACARAGLETTLVAPSPWEPWPATYGMWRDELPSLPDYAVAAAPARTVAVGTTPHRLERDYVIIDNDGLRRWLTDSAVEVVTGVVQPDGGRLGARVLVDATGGHRSGLGAEQTAYGLIVRAADAKPLVPPDTAIFMDWTGPARDPSFLYGIPIDGDRVLLEETCLARRPGLPLDMLAGRLRQRLVQAGVPLDGDEEFVRIPLDLPRPRGLAFGAAAGMVHPATGFSLADSLRLAPAVAEALRDGLRISPRHALRAARHEVWPPAARVVHTLRRFGLRALCDLPAPALPEFFELFFRLPTELQCAYTSARTDVIGTVAAMEVLFRSAPWRLRTRLAW